MSATATSETGKKVLEMRKQAAQRSASSPSLPSKSKEEAEENFSNALQQSIENSLADERIRLSIGGEKIRFKTFNGPCDGHPDSGGEISDRVALNDERLDRMNADDFTEKFAEEAEWMRMTLGWAAEPEFMTGEWFEKNISFIRCKEFLTFIQIEREYSEEQIKKLRRLGRL